MKRSVENQDPQIILIDPNRLFRERIAFLLRDEAKPGYSSVITAQSLSTLPPLESAIDLLLIDAQYLNHAKERKLFEMISAQSPNLTVILWVENATKKLAVTAPSRTEMSDDSSLQLSQKVRDQLTPIERYYALSRSVDRQAFIHLINKVLPTQREDNDSLLSTLTPREIEILHYLVKGDSNKEIARELKISESTVKVHVQNILKKFSVSSRVEAAVYAVRHELMQ
ncbi:response regulator transcription factor [Ignatzschineria cameli]|nr:response regulator transcription factor [Ignatzschineria cameli]